MTDIGTEEYIDGLSEASGAVRGKVVGSLGSYETQRNADAEGEGEMQHSND